MRAANILTSLAVLIWFSLLLVGRGLVERVAGQRVLGYPSAGQIDVYLVWPALAVIALLGTAWVCNGVRRWPWLLASIAVVALTALVPFLLSFSGGV